MTAATTPANKITISDDVVGDAKLIVESRATALSIQTQEGGSVPVPESIQRLLLEALTSVATNGEVSIRRIPEEVTSTVAADMLGVSRTTLMKWVKTGKIDSFKTGSHTRFKREDVFALQKQRSDERQAAFDELRAFDEEHSDLFEV
ncbi:MAG TPA: helix-turn-helix domain-containing protein [Candidatus Corynebacterium avicola]|uniref:Helix-turn-helix domain-containing protein n=1 Tax=Candidatus Corynebacterium avicola TaxID=2838527 RepID=A0A9D1ULB4_9CORY|nr:helix-turn-helix domain-containing protein [Candidatus Corynebacterium avicola]